MTAILLLFIVLLFAGFCMGAFIVGSADEWDDD